MIKFDLNNIDPSVDWASKNIAVSSWGGEGYLDSLTTKVESSVNIIFKNKSAPSPSYGAIEMHISTKLGNAPINIDDYSYKEMDAGKESRQIARLKDVLRYVAENYQEPIALKEAADIASLNQDYFCRMFKKCMGVTFLEYVNQVRINHIHEELLATEDSITDILEHNGFTNYKVFSRMFKAQFGMTPRELRKLQEN